MPKLAHLPLALVVSAGTFASACSSVDCEILCQRTLACQVAFAPTDDPDEEKIVTGERSELESCRLGCEESPTVTVDAADCIDGVPAADDLDQCQPPILRCLGLDEAISGGAA